MLTNTSYMHHHDSVHIGVERLLEHTPTHTHAGKVGRRILLSTLIRRIRVRYYSHIPNRVRTNIPILPRTIMSSTLASSTIPLDATPPPSAHRLELSAPEYFDLLTSDGELTGKTKLRKEVHRDGDWHAAVHIWLLNEKTGQVNYTTHTHNTKTGDIGSNRFSLCSTSHHSSLSLSRFLVCSHLPISQILLQKRAACKDSFPSCWDVSCAGHLSAGETGPAAAEAELMEELSIKRPPGTSFEQFFIHITDMKREVISQGGHTKQHEIA